MNDLRTDASTISYRDAVFRAQKLTGEVEALELLSRARSSHDSLLIEAIKQEAKRHGWNLNRATDTASLAQSATGWHTTMMDIVTDHKYEGQGIATRVERGDISGNYALEQFAPIAEKYNTKLSAVTNAAQRVTDAARWRYTNIINELTAVTGDTQAQLLAEMRATRTWQRIERELNNLNDSGDLTEVIRSKLANGKPEEKRVILEEAPTYLDAHGIHDAENLLINMLGTTDNRVAAAKSELDAAEKLLIVVNYDAAIIRNRVSSVPPSYERERRGTEVQALGGYVDPSTIRR